MKKKPTQLRRAQHYIKQLQANPSDTKARGNLELLLQKASRTSDRTLDGHTERLKAILGWFRYYQDGLIDMMERIK